MISADNDEDFFGLEVKVEGYAEVGYFDRSI